ncbi:hypothetical protein FOZ62_031701 [Perkinsus olseni]|uniref:tRNA(Ile)-lysidine synthetase n=1 Tax=Perkinsus olseni TaxID=32597 RepID=A0A7J6SMC2_PEROL|nr:hypothetical protein FOZ62_031701 [Perkinsus olseni]
MRSSPGPSVAEAAALVWDFDKFWFPPGSDGPQAFWFAMHSHLPKFDAPKKEGQRYFPAILPLVFTMLLNPLRAFLKTLVDRTTLRLAQSIVLDQPDNGAIMAVHGLYRALFLTLIFRHNGLAERSLKLLEPLPGDNETVGKFTECTKAVLCNRYTDHALSDKCNPDLAEMKLTEPPKDRHVLDELCRNDPDFLVEGLHSQADAVLMSRLKDFFLQNYPNNTVPKVLVLSLSGGVDSMTHLYLLSKLQRSLGFKLVACHIRHSNRDDAKQELQWVTYVTGRLGVPLYHHHVKLRRPHGSLKTGISRMDYERQTRDIRFSMYAKAHKLAWAAAGLPEEERTQPVVVVDENRLAELGKGNLLNINGMVVNAEGNDEDEIGNVCQVRPLLLSTRKEELIACASRHNIPYMVDSTPKWSRRGWIRGVLDLGFPPDGDSRRRFLKDLTLAGELSDALDRQVSQASIELVPHRIIPGGEARFKKQNRVVKGFNFLALDTSNLFAETTPALMSEITETKERLLSVVSRIAEAWGPAVAAYKKQVLLSSEESSAEESTSSAPSDSTDDDAEETVHKCPIQPIRVDQLRDESLTVTILLNIMIRLHDKNPVYRQQFFQGKRPSRRSVEHFCTTAETTRKPFVLTAMRKTCPGLYVSSSSYLCLFDHNSELDEASAGNRESLAKVLFNSFNRVIAESSSSSTATDH